MSLLPILLAAAIHANPRQWREPAAPLWQGRRPHSMRDERDDLAADRLARADAKRLRKGAVFVRAAGWCKLGRHRARERQEMRNAYALGLGWRLTRVRLPGWATE